MSNQQPLGAQQRQNLEALLAVGEAIIDGDLPLNLGAESHERGDCQTPCCLLGWYNRKHKHRFEWWPAGGLSQSGPKRSAVKKHFGIGDDAYDDLFGPNESTTGDVTELQRRLGELRSMLLPSSGERQP